MARRAADSSRRPGSQPGDGPAQQPGRRPGRPAGFDRTQALDALLTLFWRDGYDGATQEAMLAATGLSSSSLYRTFGTKPATFAAALERYLELSDRLLAPLERGTGGVADLGAFLDRLADQIGGPMGAAGCLAVATMTEPVNRNPAVAALTGRHLERMGAALRAAVRRGAAAGDTFPIDPDPFADVLLAAVLGVLTRARGDTAAAADLIDAVRALLPHSAIGADVDYPKLG